MTPLKEYREKRRFSKTPEPKGSGSGEEASSSGPLYVVQKHQASRLHWDFRIELDGVLLSWAVPKGPSLDPGQKRLAVHVEDHPVEYGSFEGAIPEGEYGAGTVMLWDRGTWRPDHGDPRQHLDEGHLKLELFGERLKGCWMLVRTKGYGGKQDSWLLFKERDDEARPETEFDAEKQWTTSVATGRTMKEIADAAGAGDDADSAGGGGADDSGAVSHMPELSKIRGAKKAPMPTHVGVELATLVRDAPEGEAWLHEVKYDGYRIVGKFQDGAARLLSRNGKDWTERFQPVAEEVAALGAKSALLDGEVVVVRPDGITDFQALQNYLKGGQEGTLQYFVFDALYLDGWDLQGCTLKDRKEVLRALLSRPTAVVRFADHIEGHGDAVLKEACARSLEGIVSKRRESIYRSGRGRDWVKAKCLRRQEFVVVAYTDPGGSRTGFGALGLAANDAGSLRYVGRVGTGFSETTIKDVLGQLKPLERESPPVANPPKGAQARGVHWVTPKLVAEVSFAEWTHDGVLRQPVFHALRNDKSPDDVVFEKPVELVENKRPPSHKPAADRAPDPAGHDAGDQARDKARDRTGDQTRDTADEGPTRVVAGVKLTNPERVFWPDVPLTKLDLIGYYEKVAGRMLPHVAGRPLSLVRCPEGYTGECFYQKHIEDFPSSVGTVAIVEEAGSARVSYASIDGFSGLVGLAQMGVLEVHTWGARSDDPDRPDRLVFDLDPDPALPWSQLAATALLLRSELGRLGLRCWLKSTGGKGLHVVVPIQRRGGWVEVRAFARAFVDSIVAIEPEAFTSNMNKKKRSGRIFIDYLRNSRGATFVAPYSTRARAGAPVAMPLSWTELEGMKGRPSFTVTNIAERLGSHRDPWTDLATVRQSITKAARARLGL